MCLGEYEADERVKRLPPCGHEFHMACIDLWFTNHTTCPMCRCSLLPPQEASSLSGAVVAFFGCMLKVYWSACMSLKGKKVSTS